MKFKNMKEQFWFQVIIIEIIFKRKRFDSMVMQTIYVQVHNNNNGIVMMGNHAVLKRWKLHITWMVATGPCSFHFRLSVSVCEARNEKIPRVHTSCLFSNRSSSNFCNKNNKFAILLVPCPNSIFGASNPLTTHIRFRPFPIYRTDTNTFRFDCTQLKPVKTCTTTT